MTPTTHSLTGRLAPPTRPLSAWRALCKAELASVAGGRLARADAYNAILYRGPFLSALDAIFAEFEADVDSALAIKTGVEIVCVYVSLKRLANALKALKMHFLSDERALVLAYADHFVEYAGVALTDMEDEFGTPAAVVAKWCRW